MNRRAFTSALLASSLLVAGPAAMAAESEVPEPFRGFDPTSEYRISYRDLDAFLKAAVVDVGRSTREKAAPTQAKTGTRMKVSVSRSTVNEGNRFLFEGFRDDDDARQALLTIQKDLEALPDEAPLRYFTRDEQLAYWLNLYNVTLINEINKIYPENKLKKFLTGKKSILSQKVLNVADVPLSLNDIQNTILRGNYENSPLVMYGLYQGIIGGPNIRKGAYTGYNVQRLLKNNASEFINSNRGTYSKSEKVFRASSLYDRNRDYFPDFQADLKTHLLAYLENPERGELQAASTIKPDIDDWTITDLYGSHPRIGGSFAENSAALLDATQATTSGGEGSGGAFVGTASTAASLRVQNSARVRSYVSPELIVQLQEMKAKQDATNLDKATVTVEELGEVSEESGSDESSEPEKEEND